MKLTSYLAPEGVFIGLSAVDKWDVLRRMADALTDAINQDASSPYPRDRIHAAIVERESQSSTVLGNGFAFPHARLRGLERTIFGIAVLAEPMDFGSGDDVTVVCMVLTPEERPTMALKVMSQIARLFSEADSSVRLRAAKTPAEILTILEGVGLSLDISISARDIMQPPRFVIRPESPLKEVTRQMSEAHTNAAPVQNGNGEVIGEITCSILFHYGLPDFFSQLKSASFIADFDPFEKYFYAEARARASDVMSTQFAALPLQASPLEIVFALTVLRHPKVYVVDAGKLVGIIDQSVVLDRIINI